MNPFAKLTSPPTINYTLTYFLLDRYFFLNSQSNRGGGASQLLLSITPIFMLSIPAKKVCVGEGEGGHLSNFYSASL